GRLEKFIGDAVMAVFGLPVAHDDDPARGVAAGLDLRDRVRSVGALRERLPIRIGIHTGEVVATRDAAAADFLITGDAVNTAARLQQAAAPWEVLVSERTARATGSRFAWEAPEDLDLRGREEGVPARHLAGRASAPQPSRPPLVDRVDDLRLLDLAATRAFGERRPYLVTVLAPAGTGKTRLAEEFVARVEAGGFAPAVRVAFVQCLSCGEEPSCSPVRSLLLRLLDLPDAADASQLDMRLRQWLGASGHADPDRLADLLLGSAGEGAVLSANLPAILGGWRVALELAAAERPLLLVADDLHATTDTFIALLEHAIAPAAEVPLLGLVLARTELLDRRPDWAAGHRNAMTLALAPLPELEMSRLVAAQLSDASPDVVRRIVARAGGNPFFAGELIRALSGPAASPSRLAVNAAGPDLPDTVQGTLLARIDLLPASARRMLQVGSVFGARFTAEGVSAVEPALAVDALVALEALEALEKHDLVAATPGGALAFRHALVQEAAYQTLTRRDRGALHAAAARWIEANGRGREDQLAEVIGFHWHQAATLMRAAAETAPDELTAEAVAWLRRAAEVDVRRWAGAEAVTHLRHALEIAPDEEVAAILLERIGDVVQRGDDSVEAYEASLERLPAGPSAADDELRLIGKLILVHARTQGAMGRRIPASEMAELVARGSELMQRSGDPQARARYLIACGFLPYWQAGGDGAGSQEDAAARRRDTERGLRLAREADDDDLQSIALDALSGIAQSLGQHREAREHARRRLELGDRLGLGERLDACAFVAWESCLLGDYLDALEVTARGLQLVDGPIGLLSVVHMLSWRAHAASMVGADEVALEAARSARQSWEETGRGPAAYAVHGFLAGVEVARRRGDLGETKRWSDLIDAVCTPLPPASFARAALHVAELDREALLDDVSRPAALGERSHLVERALNACLDRGWLPGRHVLDHLLREAERQSLRPLAAQVHRGLGLQGSRTHLGIGRRLAEEMGAAPLVARIDDGLATGEGQHHEAWAGTAGGGGTQ
ncbi:MAG TPA: adenylate/guanylate cyclase domain-containing protein, partial [Candidatus Limnocylindria bacterium]